MMPRMNLSDAKANDKTDPSARIDTSRKQELKIQMGHENLLNAERDQVSSMGLVNNISLMLGVQNDN